MSAPPAIALTACAEPPHGPAETAAASRSQDRAEAKWTQEKETGRNARPEAVEDFSFDLLS
jgi:hypothetical protein